MADATIKAWKCDVCGRVFEEGQPWYGLRYGLYTKIPDGFWNLEKIDYPDVCYKCAAQIDLLIEKLKGGGTVGEM